MNCIKSSKPYLFFLGATLILALFNIPNTLKADNTVVIESTQPVVESYDYLETNQRLSFNQTGKDD